MEKATQIINKLCHYVSYLSMASIAVIMFLVTCDAAMRQIFNKPIAVSYDIVTLLLTVIVFSSWSYAQTKHAHIHVTMFCSMLPRTIRFLAFGLTSLISTVYVGFMAFAAYEQIFHMIANGDTGGTWKVPIWPFVLIQFIALAIFALTLLLDTIKAFLALKSEHFADEVQSIWV